jgi:hypothetical protein
MVVALAPEDGVYSARRRAKTTGETFFLLLPPARYRGHRRERTAFPL